MYCVGGHSWKCVLLVTSGVVIEQTYSHNIAQEIKKSLVLHPIFFATLHLLLQIAFYTIFYRININHDLTS